MQGIVGCRLQTVQAAIFRFRGVPRDSTSSRIVGQVLVELRDEAHLTQEELAGRAKMDRSYISDVERGEASLSVDRLLRICKALGVPASTVVGRIEKQIGRR